MGDVLKLPFPLLFPLLLDVFIKLLALELMLYCGEEIPGDAGPPFADTKELDDDGDNRDGASELTLKGDCRPTELIPTSTPPVDCM